jgi:hypothetical protein
MRHLLLGLMTKDLLQIIKSLRILPILISLIILHESCTQSSSSKMRIPIILESLVSFGNKFKSSLTFIGLIVIILMTTTDDFTL